MRSFWERQQEKFKLYKEVGKDNSFLEEFTASDLVNGSIVKATDKKIVHGTLGIASGIAFSLFSNMGLRERRKLPFTFGYKLALLSIGGSGPFIANFGVSTYLLRNPDARAAYVNFNEWLQKRA